MSRLPCGMSRLLPLRLSNTFSLTWARIGPGRSELMPLTSTAGITLPAITMNGEAGGCSVTLGSLEVLALKLAPSPLCALGISSVLPPWKAATISGASSARMYLSSAHCA